MSRNYLGGDRTFGEGIRNRPEGRIYSEIKEKSGKEERSNLN
ncbi:MAG TPA: hypothetical protein VJA23_04045 [Candidatus Nanoarchaeia archaeon]|nr:hypothetical protein [Candidatus Nanoarchaeia archaeon]